MVFIHRSRSIDDMAVFVLSRFFGPEATEMDNHCENIWSISKTLYQIGCAKRDVRQDMRHKFMGCAPGYAPLYVNEESLNPDRRPQPTNNSFLPSL